MGQDYKSHNPSERAPAITSFPGPALANPCFYRGVVAGCSRDFCFILRLCYSCRETLYSSATPFAAALAQDPDPASPLPEHRPGSAEVLVPQTRLAAAMADPKYADLPGIVSTGPASAP